VLLDHGLYREYDDAFRLKYCNLWRALILGNVPGERCLDPALRVF
jgi:predicted unusual protein kinase regulating ubiquinone biosynthesis (AarF/ABC1/UbiB family)